MKDVAKVVVVKVINRNQDDQHSEFRQLSLPTIMISRK